MARGSGANLLGTATTLVLLALFGSACSPESESTQLSEENLCANPISSNFDVTLRNHIGDLVCIEGYLGRSSTFNYVAVAGRSDEPSQARQILLVSPERLSEHSSGARVRAIGVASTPAECADAKWDQLSPCWDGPSNLVFTAQELQISVRNLQMERCRLVNFSQLTAQPLIFAYEHICTNAIARWIDDELHVRDTTEPIDAPAARIDWGDIHNDRPISKTIARFVSADTSSQTKTVWGQRISASSGPIHIDWKAVTINSLNRKPESSSANPRRSPPP